MKAKAERAREMAREGMNKLREEEDMKIGEKIVWEGKRGKVGRVVVVEREEVEGLRDEREVLDLKHK
jgi:hypothetical protein